MTFRKLLEGPFRITTTIGKREEVIRLAPKRVEPEFRKIDISYSPVTVRKSYLFPWREDQVTECLSITATLRLRDGKTFRSSKLMRLDFQRAVEFVMLEVVKEATMYKAGTMRDIRYA